MDYFPIFMKLQGLPVLVVGGGTVAERKIRLLLKAGAEVSVVAGTLNEQIIAWTREARVFHLAEEYHNLQLQGKRLVFAATDDSHLNREVFRDAEAVAVPVNVVDDLQHCRFISPAVVDRSPIQVAITSGGASPVLARRLRAWIERLLPIGLSRVATAAAGLRKEVKIRLPRTARKGFWESQLSDRNLKKWSLLVEQEITGILRSGIRKATQGAVAALPRGRVYLVGAGPGRPDLLTLRALEILGLADVILYDRLISDEILDLARRDADRIYVGKSAGNHHRTQDEIHRLMLEQAQLGRIVVRLKGGDAFVFGRGGEELEFLRDHGVTYEVVPGITAATGCAAYSAIPLTHRDHSQTLTFVTGHLAAGRNDEAGKIDWGSIAGTGRTTVVYMGVGQAEKIRQALLLAGISGKLPVELIANGTLDKQQQIEGTVDTLPAIAAQLENDAPGLLIIGQVAALGRNLAWFKPGWNQKKAA
jgi:uroporphyrin-III C-methyltransferase/precorrin-2 dehydrogenase/sirohydrochlorin ferrochelatase